MKKQYHNASLVAGLPPAFFSFMEHLMSLQYKDTPDYEYLISLVRQLDSRAEMQPYDWEGDATVYKCVCCCASMLCLDAVLVQHFRMCAMVGWVAQEPAMS